MWVEPHSGQPWSVGERSHGRAAPGRVSAGRAQGAPRGPRPGSRRWGRQEALGGGWRGGDGLYQLWWRDGAGQAWGLPGLGALGDPLLGAVDGGRPEAGPALPAPALGPPPQSAALGLSKGLLPGPSTSGGGGERGAPECSCRTLRVTQTPPVQWVPRDPQKPRVLFGVGPEEAVVPRGLGGSLAQQSRAPGGGLRWVWGRPHHSIWGVPGRHGPDTPAGLGRNGVEWAAPLAP